MTLRVFIKQHQRENTTVIGVCDEALIGKTLKQQNFQFHVSEHFFGGDLILLDEAVPILKKCPNFNAVGENLISKLIQHEIVHPDGVLTIEKIPVALRLILSL